MQNEFLKLASSPLMNLDHTYRYSGTKLVEGESLSQHIIDTIMMGLKIIDKVNDLEDERLLNPEVYVMKAVYHDLEEVITGDIPRPLKYYDDATRDSLKHVADAVAYKFFSNQFCSTLPHFTVWRDAKLGPEGYILKIVDTLVVANKVVKEVTLLHNFYVLRVAHEVSIYLTELLKNMNVPVQLKYQGVEEYLRELIEGALQTMKELIDEHADVMDSLNIYGHSMI